MYAKCRRVHSTSYKREYNLAKRRGRPSPQVNRAKCTQVKHKPHIMGQTGGRAFHYQYQHIYIHTNHNRMVGGYNSTATPSTCTRTDTHTANRCTCSGSNACLSSDAHRSSLAWRACIDYPSPKIFPGPVLH